jgi:iron complex transport system ATP-binding protein
MKPMIELRDVNFHYGDRTIFGALSFSVAEGEMVALVGANGSGKTTLLNIIAGLLAPDSGHIQIDGREVKTWKRQELARFVALVSQHLEVPFSFHVDEIVVQGRVPHLGRFGTLSAHDHDIVEQALETADLLDLRHRDFRELSGGERQRVKIAIGLAQQAKLMLLDEPTQHLDIGRQIEFVTLLKRLNAAGITVVSAMHDLTVVRDHFQKAALLLDKDFVYGSTPDVLRPELLERAFAIEASTLDLYNQQHSGFSAQRDVCRGSARTTPTARRIVSRWSAGPRIFGWPCHPKIPVLAEAKPVTDRACFCTESLTNRFSRWKLPLLHLEAWRRDTGCRKDSRREGNCVPQRRSSDSLAM